MFDCIFSFSSIFFKKVYINCNYLEITTIFITHINEDIKVLKSIIRHIYNINDDNCIIC